MAQYYSDIIMRCKINNAEYAGTPLEFIIPSYYSDILSGESNQFSMVISYKIGQSAGIVLYE